MGNFPPQEEFLNYKRAPPPRARAGSALEDNLLYFAFICLEF